LDRRDRLYAAKMQMNGKNLAPPNAIPGSRKQIQMDIVPTNASRRGSNDDAFFL
jgi:hypothetical protein